MIETFTAFITYGLIWWSCVLILGLSLWVSEEREEYGATTFCVIIMALIFQLRYKVLQIIIANPLFAIYIAIGYLLIGGIWSVFKFYLYSLQEVEKTEQSIESYSKYDRESNEDFQKRRLLVIQNAIPKAIENKERITAWIAFWPLSLIWTGIHDIVKRVVNKIYEMLEHLYNSIANHVFRKLLDKYKFNV